MSGRKRADRLTRARLRSAGHGQPADQHQATADQDRFEAKPGEGIRSCQEKKGKRLRSEDSSGSDRLAAREAAITTKPNVARPTPATMTALRTTLAEIFIRLLPPRLN